MNDPDKTSDWIKRAHDPAQTLDTSLASEEKTGDHFSNVRCGSDQAAAPNDTQNIGRYQVERVLGQGGFGVVYLARDEQLQRAVAIKVPHRHLVAMTSAAEAYLTEARTVANLDHASIVPVYDVGSTMDHPCFIVSKYIAGTTLAQRIKDNRPQPREAAALVATIADALHYAHRQGLVHRDIKPGNILLDTNGQPFVVDFGLALKDENIGHGTDYSGTPAYMSPEQARGEGQRVDGRSDIFSLGVVLYELLIGKRPFRSDSKRELLDQITSLEPRPPRQYDDSIPQGLERICLKSLSKQLSERYSTAKDFADDLRLFLTQPSSDATTSNGSTSTQPADPSSQAVPATDHSQHAGEFSASNRLPLTAVAWRLFAVLSILAVVALSVAVSYFPSLGWQSPVVEPMKIESFVVNHFATFDGDSVRARGAFGQRSFGAARGDEFDVHITLSRPAYSYLIVFRPDGQSQVLYPQDDTDVPELTASPHYPSKRRDERYFLEEGTGLWVVALVVSETPLPSYREWQALHPNAPWQAYPGKSSTVWRDDGQLLHVLEPGQSTRGSKTSPDLEPIARLTDWLRGQVPGTLQALAFTVQ